MVFAKGAEYYANAQHMNPRGCHEVLQETEKMCLEAKKMGVTFADLLALRSKYGGVAPFDPDKDPFLAAVQKWLPAGKPTLKVHKERD